MLQLYNTVTKTKVDFVPLNGKVVTMYNCGPTVYSYAHIGNFSAYLMADLLRRYLEFSGYEVRQVKNITDVGHLTSDADTGEDKLEKAAREERKDPYAIARFYENAYLADEKRLQIREPLKRPRATEHVPEMIAMIETLLAKGYAYETDDGVYFEVEKFPAYGRLSGNTLADLAAGKRVEINEHKKQPYDFALWKKLVGENAQHIMQWPSPWGPGFPGWHIECSAMARKYLGDTLDLHSGGEDNLFPHHECEVAQSEACTGKPFVRYWLHKSYITVNEEKMSKSKGNFYVLDDVVKMGYDPLDFRFASLSVHYRSKWNFSEKALAEAKINRQKIKNFLQQLAKIIADRTPLKVDGEVLAALSETEQQFAVAMDDDLNVSAALAVIFNFMKRINAQLGVLSQKEAQAVWHFFERINSIFYFLDFATLGKEAVPEEIKDLLAQREQARQAQDFAKADALRGRIVARGYLIRDGKNGAEAYPKP